jgi:hypothetical protein
VLLVVVVARLVDDPFELGGRQAAGRAVAPSCVVEVDDPGGDLDAGLGAGGEPVPVDSSVT